MNYCKIYNDIIINRKNNKFKGYTERHHIIPKSLNGTNKKDNIVRLTAREHFICHLLLTKMYKEGSVEWIKMTKAFMNMYRRGKSNQQRYCPSKWYEYCKIKASKANSLNQKGKNNSQFGKCWIYNKQLQKSKFVNEVDLIKYLDKGWEKGRKVKPLTNKQIRQKLIKDKKQNNLNLYRHYYNIYNEFGWEIFKEKTNYLYSRQNLVMWFERNLLEFKPQNGKKRGIYK